MSSTINKRIGDIIIASNKNVREFAKIADIPQTTLNEAATKNKDIRISLIQKIANAYPNISMDWLITGKGKMLKQDAKEGINLSNVGTGNIANAGTIGSIHHPYSNNVVGSDFNADNCVKEEEKDQQIILLKEKVLHLEEMLQEKERLIQILLKK